MYIVLTFDYIIKELDNIYFGIDLLAWYARERRKTLIAIKMSPAKTFLTYTMPCHRVIPLILN